MRLFLGTLISCLPFAIYMAGSLIFDADIWVLCVLHFLAGIAIGWLFTQSHRLMFLISASLAAAAMGVAIDKKEPLWLIACLVAFGTTFIQVPGAKLGTAIKSHFSKST